MKRWHLLLILIVLLLCSTAAVAQAEEYTVPSGSFSTKVAYLKNVFPEGWYWNEWTSSQLGSATQKTITINGYTTTISTKPCTKHTSVQTSCNSFNSGSQCTGWARMLFTLVWGITPYDNGYMLCYLPETDDAYLLDYIKPGDIIWYGTHSMFVVAVNGDTLTVSDCNSRYTCGIQWSRTITKSDIHSKMKSNGKGRIWSPTPFTVSSSNWESWRCIYSEGVNIRCQPFAKTTKIVGGVSNNEIFYVDADHITTTSAGTWGLCKTSDGETGWIKISDTTLCERVKVEVTDSTPRIAVSKKEATGNDDDDQCYIKAGPYEAETTIRVVPMDGVIYISGCVTNTYGNTWYITEDGYYVWSGDVTVKEPDITIQSETDFRGAAVAVTNGCNLKDKPYAAAAHQANVAKGQSVQVVAQIVNYHGNTWYRTESGKYVSAEEVEIFQADYSHYTDLNVSFVWKTDAYTRALPYSAMPRINSVITGQVLQVKRAVINKYGNIWVQLDDGNFLCLYDKETYQNYGEFYEFSAAPYVNANNLVLPSGTLPAGEDFTVSGTLEGVNNCPIAVVHLYISEYGTGHGVVDCELRPTTPVSSVDLNADLNANDAIDFASLAPGDYHATLRIIMGFKFNDYPWFFNKSYEILARTTFSIPSTEEPACEHPDAEWVVIKMNSCTEDGLEHLICPDCNELLDTYTVPAIEHLASQWETVMEPTCTEEGERIRTCVWCGDLLDTDTLPPTDHPCDWRYTTEPTCTEKGEGEVYCTSCGLILERETTPPTGHTEGDWVVITEATTTATGLKRQSCTVCGVMLAEEVIPVKEVTPLANITMSAGANLTAVPGGTVTVPVSIRNPDGVVLGTIVLEYQLPPGVSVTQAAIRGNSTSPLCLDPTQFVVLEGVTVGTLDITFALDESVAFPVSIKVSPLVLSREDETEASPVDFTVVIEEAANRIPGDVNDDGKVTYADLLRLAKYLANWEGIVINESNANCSGDAKVSYADLLRLAKHLAGWDVVLE